MRMTPTKMATKTAPTEAKKQLLNKAKARGRARHGYDITKLEEELRVKNAYTLQQSVRPLTDKQQQQYRLQNVGKFLNNFLDQNIANGGSKHLSLASIAKTLGTATDASGGFAVPDDFQTVMVEKLYQFGSVGNVVRRIPTSEDTIKNVIEDNGNPSVNKVSTQGSKIPESTITIANRDIKIHDNFTLIPINNQAIRDWKVVPSPIEFALDRIARALTRNEEKEIMQGTGDAQNQMTGLSTKLTKSGGFNYLTAADATTKDAITGEDMLRLYYSLPEGYAQNGTFIVRRDIAHKLHSFGNTNANNYFVSVAQSGASVPRSNRHIYGSSGHHQFLHQQDAGCQCRDCQQGKCHPLWRFQLLWGR